MKEQIEEERKKIQGNKMLAIIVIIMLSVIVAFIYKTILAGILVCQVGILVVCFFMYKQEECFRRVFKQYYVETYIGEEFKNVTYDTRKGFDIKTVILPQIIKIGNTYKSDDYFSGQYKGVNFEQADVTIQKETRDAKGNKQIVTYFKGRWMIFDFHKPFTHNLKICEKFMYSDLKRSGYKKVDLEDIEFNKKFNIFAKDSHEAFYILTPHLMESLKNIEKLNKGQMFFCFSDSKLHIGICNNKEMFKFKSYKQEDETKIKEQIEKEMEVIKVAIDQLCLDGNIFKK